MARDAETGALPLPDHPTAAKRPAWPPALARGAASLALIALVLLAVLAGRPPPADARTADGPAILLSVDGPIGPATTEYLEAGLETAAGRRASVVVVRIDTPGGLSSSTRDIVRAILASPVPVVTYVAPSGARAASAGTYILYASGVAAMAPGTNLGAATPIRMGGGGPLPGPGGEPEDTDRDGEDAPADAAGAKAVNDAVAFLKSLAELHGRDAAFAEAAVREAASLSAREALERGVVEIVAEDLDALLAALDGRTARADGRTVTLATAGATVETVEPGWRSRLLAVIGNPNIAYILMLIGIYGIIFELASPGSLFPGTIGAISLLLGLYSLNLVGIDFAGAGLVLLGIALMVAEALVPSFGVLGVGGAIAFALGSLFMVEEAPGFRLSMVTVGVATLVSLALLAVALAAVLRAYRRRTAIGGEAIVGAVGKVLRWSGGEGEVHLHGERWHATSPAALSPGDRVEITGRDELTLRVKPADAPDKP